MLGVIADTAGGSWRLNHTYSICRWCPPSPPTHTLHLTALGTELGSVRRAGGQTGLHGAGTPVSTKTSYRCDNGQMISALTKAVFPLLDSDADTGCFACMSAHPNRSYYTFFATTLALLSSDVSVGVDQPRQPQI